MRQRTIVLSLLALAACGRAKTADVPIETAPVERRTIIVDAQATGVVEPINVVEVKSKSSGQIVQMPVEVGTEVRPGDLLVQLDPRDVKNQYDQAAADLAAAKARQDVASSQRKRSQDLFDAQIITRQELESASLEDENAKAQMVRSRTNLDIAQQRLDEATVRAPVAGTVIDKPVSIGQVIASATGSASGGTTILKMADLNKVRVRALVNESDIGNIQAGMPARVVVDAYPDRPFTGTVEKIEPQAVVEQSVTMFPVLIALSNEGGLLKPGMNGEVSVIVDQHENVLAIPNDAIRTMREVQMAARMLGLDPDSVQAQLRAQFSGGPSAAGPRGDTAAPAGAEVRVARGDVALQPPQGPSGGRMPQITVTDEQCRAVDAAFARHPNARQELDAVREKMMSGGDRQALMAESRRIYAGLGVEAQVVRACQRRGAEAAGAPGRAPAVQGAPNGAGAAQGAPRQGGGGMAGGGGRGGMGGGAMGGGGRGRTGLVFVRSGTTYVPRSVRLGASDFDYTQIISGVEEGEEVALLAAAALQAQRNDQNDRMRSRMSVPGMSRTPTTPAGGGAAGGGAAGGGRPQGR
ncbi:MAG: efflux RND transporter periplasmic adaptor subunit [Gemmatimonadaceae bacterium]